VIQKRMIHPVMTTMKVRHSVRLLLCHRKDIRITFPVTLFLVPSPSTQKRKAHALTASDGGKIMHRNVFFTS
jgi:hypothetical protein